MTRFATKARTALALGVPNLARVAAYRLGVRGGLNPVRRLLADAPSRPFFSSPIPVPVGGVDSVAPSDGKLTIFGWMPQPMSGGFPDWHRNAFTHVSLQASERSWWQIPDFDRSTGDIKGVWEASRFGWVIRLARGARQGNPGDLEHLNAWLDDWCRRNLPYLGPNWKCGQEASIRLMHLAAAALLLGQERSPSTGLAQLVTIHLQRIAPTIGYAIAQNNNHGTSEAAALFIGGEWLAGLHSDARGRRWARLGRKWLENRAARLIEPDGSFSQYSVNYHRVMLDTYSIAELWRRRWALAPFSDRLYERLQAASNWLRAFVDPGNGDAPNIGANDGARLLPLTDSDYRDYRPSVQLASVLFLDARAYERAGVYDEPLRWLDVAAPDAILPPLASEQFDHGGYAVLRRDRAAAWLRYPRFRFRPSHADALHLDFWLAGENILRDGGSYSSNTDPQWLAYFPGTASHNTVQFDSGDQMPRLGRFLFGDWLKTKDCSGIRQDAESVSFAASYRGGRGVEHAREVEMTDGCLRVADRIRGFRRKAVLRWRLKPTQWRVDGNRVQAGSIRLGVSADVPITRVELVEGYESRYFLQKSRLPVLEVEVDSPGTLTTEVSW